ncbi:MAG: 1-acyl-sn-glycerol-3-phosphate acyltransferase [Oscillospiraceae bacterium]|nr:1-acyl-sn-glycerol-3-phosphate acyltransferase [Oscillospiraceae bacterium]
MKIRCRELDYEQVLSLPPMEHTPPRKQSMLVRRLLRALSLPELKKQHFSCEYVGMEALGADEPALVLMNHSSFVDMKIAAAALYPRPFNIVCTYDGFVGKKRLMKALGCIPTRKFVSDVQLLRDMEYALHTLRSDVLMFPEAGYSFDGTATVLPDSLGKCLKLMKVSVVMITTQGAFSRDPLYNMLQLRDVPLSARVEYLLSPEQVREKSVEELNETLRRAFSFDSFRWQQEKGIAIRESFRADGLNRVLYKCTECLTEGEMEGRGTTLRCRHCGSSWELDERGSLISQSGTGRFSHVPDWYRWERECVREELRQGSYRLDVPVDIRMLVDTNCLYRVGRGRLRHDAAGFRLTGCDGKLDYRQPPLSSYTLNADYFWYELGDMISIGDRKALYYCFPTEGGDVVAKTRLATEELYQLEKARVPKRVR